MFPAKFSQLSKFCSVLCVVLFSVSTVSGQLTVNANKTAAVLSSALAGPGITISGATLSCPGVANGLFTVTPGTIMGTGPTAFGITSGIMLTTGKAVSAAGLESVLASTNNGAPGDPTLTILAGATTYDACILEFDVTPVGDTIRFNYQFGSEEYNHSTCGPYNDAFAFYISGPGITGTQNMALVPGTTIPVTVNSVNSGIPGPGYTLANCTIMGPGSPFTSYFVDNTGGSFFTYKGFTTKLTAWSAVTPCATYHLKLTIADAGNSIYDSGVFIEEGSLTTPTITGSTTLCVGSTTTLSYGITGGTWSSTPTSVATVGSTTGVVTGVGAGTATITYTFGTGCYATTVVTVNATTPITGTPSVCAGSTITLSNTTPGGTWSSGNTLVATVGSSTGVVTGIATGTAPISYTTPAGCVSSVIVTVNPLPAAITGSTTVCIGATTGLTDGSPGGTWVSSVPGVATVGSSTGVVTGVATGTTIITYTLPTGCKSMTTVTVNTAYTGTVSAAICAGGSYSFGGSTYTTSGTYTHTFTTAHCDSIVTLNLLVHALSTSAVYDSICQGQSFMFGGTPRFVPGTYTYVTPDIYGCDSTITLNLFVKPLPPAPGVVSPVTYCQGQPSAQLTASGTNLLWYTVSSGGTGSTIAPVPATGTAGNTYYYVNQTVNGCQGPDAAIEVIVSPTPDATIHATKTVICSKDTITFYTAVQTPDSYLWTLPRGAGFVYGTPSFPGPIIVSFDSTGDYFVNLTVAGSAGSCAASDSIQIRVLTAPEVSFYSKPEVCVGDTVVIALTSVTPGVTYFTWNFGDATIIAATDQVNGGPYKVTWHTPGVHYVTTYGTISGECQSKTMIDSVDVVPLPTPQIMASSTNICQGDSVFFSTAQVPGDMFQWTPGNFFNNENKPSIYGKILLPGYVHVTETTPVGCKGFDSVFVSAQTCCSVLFPNAFTPGGTTNNVFRPITDGHHVFHMFRIYNRWGQCVFETSNDRDGWDGRFNGVPQDLGTYYYLVSYDCNGATIEEKGEVTLVR